MDISFFTTLKIGWINAWIPSFTMILIEFIYLSIFKEGGKRALNSSWRSKKDTINYTITSVVQITLLILSIFVPIKLGTLCFIIGTLIYIFSLAGFIWSIHSYAAAPANKVINNGIYRWSRNPMYVCYFFSILGTIIASASLWMFILLITLITITHFSILAEEQYCEKTYGKAYLEYKEKTPRYLLK